ncbi:MAG: DEAD/DEAH box helicase family protein [Lachnospiraceae bacterium]|nr:DEAD/DEAH box helicase family protein [Lachnospiraceae bacterium]
MSLYEGVAFKGTLRDYQQRILDNAGQYIAEGKLNIIAPPGSGKTILGLELIRRIGEPCLIISPTEATITHWGKKLKECFLLEESLFEQLFSRDLDQPKAINAITYEELEENMLGYEFVSDGEKLSIRLRGFIRKNGIKTICLDEPHHLKESQLKALERMRKFLQRGERVISLTATPPCRYEKGEPEQFLRACGEPDARIFAPELVAEKVFCPHQDYVYFNYPSVEEAAFLREYMERVRSALEEIGQLECVQASVRYANTGNDNWSYHYNYQYDAVRKRNPEAYLCIFQVMKYYGLDLDANKSKNLTGARKLPPLQMKDLQTGLQFLLDYSGILDAHRIPIFEIIKKYNLYQRKQVQLIPEELMQKTLTESVGKLESIRTIVRQEYGILGKDLRLLVFAEGAHQNTDNLDHVGTYEEFKTVDAISIFETLRRWTPDIKIGVLTESVLILPAFPELQGTMLRMGPLGNTGYVKVEFFGGMVEAMEMVKALFQEGKLQVLIGNESLLEEDWEDTPINSLILPGCRKDFALADRIRGMCLHRDANNPDKTLNIWHLATLVPADMVGDLGSYKTADADKMHGGYLESRDFEMVRERFQLFMGPHYETGKLVSTINRVTLLRPPFDAQGIQRINKEMLKCAADRQNIQKLWQEKVEAKRFQILQEVEIVSESVKKIPFRLGWYITDKRLLGNMGEALKGALVERGFISSAGEVHVEQKRRPYKKISVSLRNANFHDQHIFIKLFTDILSQGTGESYVLDPQTNVYSEVYAYPDTITKVDKLKKIMANHLEKRVNGVEMKLPHTALRQDRVLVKEPYERKKYILICDKEKQDG